MKPSFTIPIAIVLGGAIVAGAVYFSMTAGEPSTSSGSGNPALVRPVGPDDHILGNPAAPVKIVEYADFDCSYCKGFDTTLHQIVANEGAKGQVAWVYREFPLTELHPDAFALAEAAECANVAGGNDAFWRYADLLFQNQPVSPSDAGAIAAQAGVPGDAFTACMTDASSTVAARITADRQNAMDAGARGTPYALILAPNRAPVVIDGAQPYDSVKQLIDAALASLSQ